MMRKVLLLLIALAGLSFAAPAMAQTITVNRVVTGTAPVLGNVVRGSAATTFSISTSGVVTQVSGDAIRMTSAGVTPPTITINCAGLLTCLLRGLHVTVVASGASGDATISKLRLGPMTGCAVFSSWPVDAPTLAFDILPVGYGTASFPIGMDVLLPAGATSGTQTYSYTVTVSAI